MSRVSDSRGAFVLCSTIRFASRYLDTAALLGGTIDKPPMFQECDRATLAFSLRGRRSTLVLLATPRIFAGLDEKPPWPLPVFHFLKTETYLGISLQSVCGVAAFSQCSAAYLNRPTVLSAIPRSYGSCPSCTPVDAAASHDCTDAPCIKALLVITMQISDCESLVSSP